jgi:hypothetical protein
METIVFHRSGYGGQNFGHGTANAGAIAANNNGGSQTVPQAHHPNAGLGTVTSFEGLESWNNFVV